MTIASDTRQTTEFAGPQDEWTDYAFSFRLHDSAMLEVVIRTDGGEPVASDPINYNVHLSADQYTNPGGTVTFVPALLSTETLQIRSNLTLQQESDLTVSNTYNPRTVEDAIDYLTMCIQDLARKAGV
jgi:hypothetical protein